MNATNPVAHDLVSPANAVGNPRTPKFGVSFWTYSKQMPSLRVIIRAPYERPDNAVATR